MASPTAHTIAKVAKLADHVDATYLGLFRAARNKGGTTSPSPESQALPVTLLRLSGVLRSLCTHLRALQRYTTQPKWPTLFDLGRLSACEDALNSLDHGMVAGSGFLRQSSQAARCQWVVLDTVPIVQLALRLKTWHQVMAALSGPLATPPDASTHNTLAVLCVRESPSVQPGQRMLDALCGRDHSTAMFWDLLNTRCPGTAEWIFAHDAVREWIQGGCSRLHLHGSPGCGKSVLAATIVDRLARTIASSTTSLCYYFVDHRTPNGLAHILGTLLAQVLAQSPIAYAKAERFFGISEESVGSVETPAGGLHPNPWSEDVRWVNYKDPEVLATALRSAMEEFGRNYLVLDGIDELLQTETLERLFSILGTLSWLSAKILIIGRPMNLDKAKVLHRIPQGETYDYIQISACSEDIRIFAMATAETAISRLPSGQVPPALLRTGINATAEYLTAAGNFRYTQCQLWYLAFRGSEVKQELAGLLLPRDDSLASTYAAIVEAISVREAESSTKAVPSRSEISRARSVLGQAFAWLWWTTYSTPDHYVSFLFSKRSFFECMSLILAPEAQSLQDLEPAGDVEARFAWYFDALLSEKTTTVPLGLAGLGTTRPSAQTTQYSFHHWTFVEFLANAKEASGIDIDFEKAATSLAVAALRYLNFPEFNQPTEEIKFEQLRAHERHIRHPFYRVASAWLPEMIRHACWRELESFVFEFFSPSRNGNFIAWFIEYCSFHAPWKYDLGNLHHTSESLIHLVDELVTGRLSKFHIAASLGLTPLCRAIAERTVNISEVVNAESSFGSPLALAVLGPRAFTMCEDETWKDFFVPLKPGRTSARGVDARGTITYLLELGASVAAKMPGGAGEGLTSIGTSALLRCAFLGDAELFIRLVTSATKPRKELDLALARALNGFFPPDRPELATPVVLHNTLARFQKRVLSPDSEAFLDRVCQYLIDECMAYVLDQSWDGDSDCLLTAAWNCAVTHDLQCSRILRNSKLPRRPLKCSDLQYAHLWETNLREFQPLQLLRLMQDGRCDVNQSLAQRGPESVDESAGQMALHIVAENCGEIAYGLAKILIERGANISAQDVRGRTPLHVAEQEDTIRLLLGHGADPLAQDSDGRTVWHVAAANNDIRTLQQLIKWHERQGYVMQSAMRCVTKKGRTPLAEALAFFHERPRWADVRALDAIEPSATRLLLPLCKNDPLCFRADIPLIHLATEWGNESLLMELAEAGGVQRGVVTARGETAYHHLSVAVSESFIEALGRVYGQEYLATFSAGGKSAVEAFMDTVVETAAPGGNAPPHPETNSSRRVDPSVFPALLVPAVVHSKDDQGRTFWERFCYNIIATYCDQFRDPQSMAVDAALHFVEALRRTDAVEFYEEHSSKSGILPLVTAVWTTSRYIPAWFSVPCLTVLVKSGGLGDAKTDENVILTLRWAITGGKTKLAELLLDRGADVHSPARGTSIFDDFHKYDLAMFSSVLAHADKTKLNRLNQFGRAVLHNVVGEGDANGGRGGIPNRQDKIVALVKAGANIDVLTEDRMSPLVLATMKSHQDCAIILLEMGASTSLRLPDGLDVSLAAASRGSVRVLRKLKEMNIPGWDWLRRFSITVSLARETWKKRIFQGCHALHIAALNCQVGTLRFYFEEDLISIDEPCYDHKMTALHFAAIGGASDAIRYLVEQGANIDAANINGLTPLHVAVQARHPDAVRTLLSLNCDKSLRDRDGRTALLLSIQWNVPLCFNLLKGQEWEKPLDADGQSSGGSARPVTLTATGTRYLAEALENAIMIGDTGAISTVIKEGCPVDVPMPSCHGCSGLALAVRVAKAPVVKLLLDRGAARFAGGCQRHSIKGISAVFEAAVRPQTSTCLMLVLDGAMRLGANWLNAQLTPLHVATQQKNLAGVTAILKHIAANAAAYNRWLPSPLPLDTGKKQPTIHPVVREIVNRRVTMPDDNYYADDTTALHLAITNDILEIAQTLVNKGGADVNALDSMLCTPLHRAVSTESEAAINFLLDNGAAVDLRDREGYTPLMRAARAGSVELCRLLIERGKADVWVRDLDGMSLLSCCAEQSRSPALFAYLCSPEVGLDPYARDKTTYSPLHDAILNAYMTGYVFAGQFDFYRVANGVDLLKSLITLVVEDGSGRSILPRLWRRWPRYDWDRYVNACPGRYVSPLCMAATKGYLWEIEWLLRHGADVELEGAAEGTALMVACSHGRKAAVELLVRLGGAHISYRTMANEGVEIVRNALDYAKNYRDIVRWLLVGRYTEQAKLTSTAFVAKATAAIVSQPGETASSAPEVMNLSSSQAQRWGRVWPVQYAWTGTNRDYGRTHRESLLAYLLRVEDFKASLRGKVIVPFSSPL